jgi:hypothetical protein
MCRTDCIRSEKGLAAAQKMAGRRWDEIMGECWLRRAQLDRAWARGGEEGVRLILRRIFHKLSSTQNLDRNPPNMPRVYLYDDFENSFENRRLL